MWIRNKCKSEIVVNYQLFEPQVIKPVSPKPETYLHITDRIVRKRLQNGFSVRQTMALEDFAQSSLVAKNLLWNLISLHRFSEVDIFRYNKLAQPLVKRLGRSSLGVSAAKPEHNHGNEQ